MSAILNTDFFTAVPQKRNVANLRENLYISLIEKMLYKIQYVETNMRIDLGNIKAKIISLDLKKKLCSGIFVFDSSLACALKNQNIDQIIDVLHELDLFLTNIENLDNYKIESISTRSWEKYFINVLREQDIKHPLYKTVIVRPTLGINLVRENEEVKYILDNLSKVDEGLSEEFQQYVTYLKFFIGKASI